MAQNEDVFAGQEFELRLDTGIDWGSSGISNVQIHYTRPNPVTGLSNSGSWPATLQGTEVVRQMQAVDTEGYWGEWQFQAFLQQSAEDQYGKIVYKTILQPIEV